MGQRRTRPVQRSWFADVRSPERRMCVSSHPDEGTVVVSLWNGGACTGSFRLTLAECSGLIGHLANSMATGLSMTAIGEEATPTTRRRFSAWARRWLRRSDCSGGHLRLVE